MAVAQMAHLVRQDERPGAVAQAQRQVVDRRLLLPDPRRHAKRAQGVRVAAARKIGRRAILQHRDIFVERLQAVAVQLAPGPGDAKVLDDLQRQHRQPDRGPAAARGRHRSRTGCRFTPTSGKRSSHVGQRLLLRPIQKIPEAIPVDLAEPLLEAWLVARQDFFGIQLGDALRRRAAGGEQQRAQGRPDHDAGSAPAS